MKKKILLGIGIGFVLVIVLVFVVVGFFLGDVVKTGINTVGPKVTQTALSVDSVSVRPLLGWVNMNNFVLGNPQEYIAKATNAISVGKVEVEVKPMSVLSDKIVVKNLEVHDAVIDFVGNPIGANNLKKIQANVDAFTGGAKPAGTNAPAKPSGEKPAKKLQVDNILITGAKVRFNGTTLALPDIHLTDLGKGEDGITPAALLSDILGQITLGTVKAIAGSVGDAGKAIGDEATKAVKSMENIFKKN